MSDDDGEADTLPLTQAGANLMGSDLYNNLIRYFIQHLRSLCDVRTYSLTLWTRCPVCTIPLDAVLASHDVHSQASDPLVDEPLLRYYAQEWDRYTTGANIVNRFFTYLNCNWVKREKDKGRKNVYTVYIVRRLSLPQNPR